jgi:Antibiotic biosynthesis monooxygenase
MPTISENGLFTVFAEFDVDPGVQRQLINEIADTVAETTVHHDGFVSASFHASVDGRRVVITHNGRHARRGSVPPR